MKPRSLRIGTSVESSALPHWSPFGPVFVEVVIWVLILNGLIWEQFWSVSKLETTFHKMPVKSNESLLLGRKTFHLLLPFGSPLVRLINSRTEWESNQLKRSSLFCWINWFPSLSQYIPSSPFYMSYCIENKQKLNI